MSSILAIGFSLLVLTFISYMLNRKNYEYDKKAWDEFSTSGSFLNKALSQVAKPWAGSKAVTNFNNSKTYEFLALKLNAGSTFSSNVEVYVSVQIASILIGCMLLVTAFFLHGILEIGAIFLALAISLYPAQEMLSKAEKRGLKLSIELPDYAELFLMVAPSMSIPAALSFTNERSIGVISAELNELVKAITQRTLPENEAFALTSRRLGTPDGRQFIAIIEDGYINGSKVVEQVRSLAEQMRRSEFQRKRGLAKKLPVKLVIIFAIHFMPLLLGLAFLPVVYGLTSGF